MTRTNGSQAVLCLLAVLLAAASVSAAELANGFRPAGVAQKWSDLACVGQELPLVGDFDGNGKDDLIMFERETSGQQGACIVCLSDGTRFSVRSAWIDRTCMANEIPVVGDFNGDQKDDIAAFARDVGPAAGRDGVKVALSQGPNRFSPPAPWHPRLCAGQQIPLAGDFNGDGRDDIVVFVRDHPSNPEPGIVIPGQDAKDRGEVIRQQNGNVLVALSGKQGFTNPAVWHSYFCEGNETPKVADVDGDGKDDIATFVPSRGEVFVALSDGTRFGQARAWKSGWAQHGEVPEVGRFNDDRFVDLVAFGRTPPPNVLDRNEGDVFVALSQFLPLPQHFGATVKRHDYFGVGNEIPLVGDFNGDGRDDLCTLVRETAGEPGRGDAYVALSGFGDPRSYRFKLEGIHCNSMSESPLVGKNGDEPYFVLIGFRSRFGTPGSTQVWRVNTPYEFVEDFAAGADANIPANMGECVFPNVAPFTIADGILLRRPEIMGCMVLCLEHDNSSFSIINEVADNAINNGVRPAITNLVERRQVPMTAEEVRGLINEANSALPGIISAIEPSTVNLLRYFFDAVGDADDFVNYHVFLWLAADPECEEFLQAPGNLPGQVHFGLLKDTLYSPRQAGYLNFNGGTVDGHAAGASYSVHGGFELLP